jgi:hypothetical protein
MMTFLEFHDTKRIHKRHHKTAGQYEVYLVDATKVRETSKNHDDFSHVGTHVTYPWVPDREVWIADTIPERERKFLIKNGVAQYEAKRKGIKDWYGHAVELERQERAKVDGYEFVGKHKQDEVEVRSKVYCKIADVTVWLVDGRKVRDVYRTNFVCGGNAGPYPWIPEKEIWIEKDMPEKEIIITSLHEYVEYVLMRDRKMSYAEAHPISLCVDWNNRRSFTKTDLESLTRYKALDLADKNNKGTGTAKVGFKSKHDAGYGDKS